MRPRGDDARLRRKASLVAAAGLIAGGVAVPYLYGRHLSEERAFRAEVTDLLAARFGIDALPVADDPLSIQIGKTRRDLASLYATASTQSGLERHGTIYLWFLGEGLAAAKGSPSDTPQPQPAASKPQDAVPGTDTKKVRVFRVDPDGTVHDGLHGDPQ